MCEVKDKELNEELEQEVAIEDMTREELIDVVYSLLSQKDKEVEVDTDCVQEIKVNKEEFQAGVDAFSFTAGAFSVLNSVDYPKDMIHEFLINRETIEFNLELNSQTCKNNKEVTKIQEVKQEQNQI